LARFANLRDSQSEGSEEDFKSENFNSEVWEAEVDEDSEDSFSIGDRNLVRLIRTHESANRNHARMIRHPLGG